MEENSLETQTVPKVKQETVSDWETTSLYEDPDLKETDAPKNFGGPLPKFKWLCETLLDKLAQITADNQFYSTISKYERKVAVVRQFITEWRSVVGPNIYPALVLILPKRDRSRVYGMKDVTLGRHLLKILKIPKTSPDAQMVMKWKQSYSFRQQQMSDVCIELIKKRQTDQKGDTLTIADVNNILDQFASLEANSKTQMDLLTKCLDTMSFVELKYFFDIILKLKVDKGMENTLLNMWHPDAVQYLSVVTSLKAVAYKLYDPTKRLNAADLTINLGKPFAPQLCKKPKFNYLKIVERFNKDFYVEEKLDGERIQVHYQNRGEVIKYWSRRATDYTYLYGGPKGEGCISKHIRVLDSVKSCVLDGEMIVCDPVRDMIVPFGVLKGTALEEQKRLFEKDDSEQPRPLFMAFDILYLNGVSLASYPLYRRKDILNEILIDNRGFIEKSKANRLSDEQAIKNGLEKAIENGSEGIILKQAKSRYHIDERSDSWLKVKPEYFEEFGENVDLVVIGREKSKKDMYYCGLRVTTNDTDTYKEPKFWCFCRVANGFDHEDYRKINDMTKGKWKNYESEKPPESLIEFGKRAPVEWIDPRKSFVIEVKARSIDRSVSRNYRTSTTLYNAYKRFIRDDKDWRSATTLDEYKEIKDNRRSLSSEQHKLQIKNKRIAKKRQREEKDEEVWNHGEPNDNKLSNLFDGLTFMVLSDCFYHGKRYSIYDLFEIIHKNGGKTTKNQARVPDVPNLRIISDKMVVLAKALSSQGFDILRSSWLFDCLNSQQIIKYIDPEHCLMVSERLSDKSLSRVDDSGLSFVTTSSLASVKKAFQNLVKLEDEEMVDDYDGLNLKEEFDLFGGLKAYVLGSMDNVEQKLVKFKIRAQGGTIVDEFEEYGKFIGNLIVVCNADDETVLKEVKRIRRRLADIADMSDYRTLRLVNSGWVDESIKEHAQVDPQDFPVIHSQRNDNQNYET